MIGENNESEKLIIAFPAAIDHQQQINSLTYTSARKDVLRWGFRLAESVYVDLSNMLERLMDRPNEVAIVSCTDSSIELNQGLTREEQQPPVSTSPPQLTEGSEIRPALTINHRRL